MTVQTTLPDLTRPGLRQRLGRVGLDQWLTVAVFLATIAGSSVTWYALGLRCGFPQGLAAVPTIALDVGGIAFGRNWILGATPALRKWGKITTIAAVALSVAGNGAEHAIAAGVLSVGLLLIIVVGMVSPAVLFAVAHQHALRLAATRPDDAPQDRPEAPPAAVESEPAEPAPVRRTVPAARTGGTVVTLPATSTLRERVHAEYRHRALALLALDQPLDQIKLADVDRAAGAKPGYAKKFVGAWRDEVAAEHQARQEG